MARLAQRRDLPDLTFVAHLARARAGSLQAARSGISWCRSLVRDGVIANDGPPCAAPRSPRPNLCCTPRAREGRVAAGGAKRNLMVPVACEGRGHCQRWPALRSAEISPT